MPNENQYEEWRRSFLQGLYKAASGEALKFVEVQKVVGEAGSSLRVFIRLPGVAEGSTPLTEEFIDGIARTLRRDGWIDIKEDGQQRIVEVALMERGVEEVNSWGSGAV